MRTTTPIRWLLLLVLLVCAWGPLFAQVGVLISIAPPALPVYEQPLCPGAGYIWTPGYWAYANEYDDYYWVPGTWVMAPQVGLLWTPPYWGWAGSGFAFYSGYWGRQVGFYGGVNYGYGYSGRGYEGGRWNNGQFYYNRSVNNVNVTKIHNVYNTTVINQTTVNHVSYNGGNGGINARATPAEETAMHQQHVQPVAAQNEHVQAAMANPQLRASRNQGKPPIAATAKPGALNDRAAVPAKEAGAPYHPPANRATATPEVKAAAPHSETGSALPVHAKDLPPHPTPTPGNTGNPKADQKYLQQQQKLATKQQQDHQKLQQSQEQDHQRIAQQKSPPAKTQQVEQKHQQQTQQMEQKHQQQTQQMQQKHQQQQSTLQAKQQPTSHSQTKSANYKPN